MTVSIQIHIPDNEIGDGLAALERRMAVLGYGFGHKAVQIIGGTAPVRGDGDPAAPQGVQIDEHDADPAIERNTLPAKVEPKKTRAKKADPAPNITAAPEARVDPEVEAQDEADEAAEVAASAPARPQPTAEDLRAAMGAYAAKFGMSATLEDGTAIFKGALGEAPEGGWKLSVVAGIGGETLAKAERAWSAAAAGEARYGG
jgi:hypothetical protein